MKTSNIQHSTSREHPTTNHQTNERHPTSARHWNLKFGASLVLGAWCLALPLCETVFAQGTAFTYQGRLNSSGAPASGTYNLTFSLFNVNSGGSAVAGPVTTNGVIITNGLFTVLIDFGSGVFTGETNWLQIGVETNGAGSFTDTDAAPAIDARRRMQFMRKEQMRRDSAGPSRRQTLAALTATR